MEIILSITNIILVVGFLMVQYIIYRDVKEEKPYKVKKRKASIIKADDPDEERKKAVHNLLNLNE